MVSTMKAIWSSCEMGVERQRHGAVRHLLGHQEVAAAVAELEIVPLQMQRIAIGRGLDVLDAQILDDRVAAGAREAGPRWTR